MSFDDDAFARSLANLRPVKAEMDPASVLYQAGFAAGAAESKAGAGLLLRTAAVALMIAALSAGGGFYFGHERGERTGYLAATTAPADTAPEENSVAPETPAKPIEDIAAEASEPVEQPIASPPEGADRPRRSPGPRRIAAAESPAWQWIIQQLALETTIRRRGLSTANSPLRIGSTDGQWEELVNFDQRPHVRPRATDEQSGSGSVYVPPVDRPLTIAPSEEWLREITTY